MDKKGWKQTKFQDKKKKITLQNYSFPALKDLVVQKVPMQEKEQFFFSALPILQ